MKYQFHIFNIINYIEIVNYIEKNAFTVYLQTVLLLSFFVGIFIYIICVSFYYMVIYYNLTLCVKLTQKLEGHFAHVKRINLLGVQLCFCRFPIDGFSGKWWSK